MGAAADGKKELIAVADGYRESEQSWRELLLDVNQKCESSDPNNWEEYTVRKGNIDV